MTNSLFAIATIRLKNQSGNATSRSNEAGQALVIAAVSLTVLMLAAGLSIDMGYLRYQKRRMQTAADSAAIAGATQLGGDWTGAATTDAGLNGFSSSNGSTVTPTAVTCPDGTANCIQVRVTQPQPVFFMKIVSASLAPAVTAIATAEQVPGLGCMYALGNGPDAVMIGPGYHTIVAGATCGMVDNGGMVLGTGASHTLYAQSVGVGIAYQPNPDPRITPNPTTLQVTSSDPFATLPSQGSPGTCPPGTPASGYVAGTFDYPCGLSMSPNPWDPSITMQPGLYRIGGTGLVIGANGGRIFGTGVSFYVTDNAPVSINAGVDESVNFGTNVQFQAPPDGPTPGVVLFQDRSDTQAVTLGLAGFPAEDFTHFDSYMWGAVYAPGATVTVTGMGYDNDTNSGLQDKCSTVPRLTTVIANKLVFSENVNFSSNDCVWPPAPISTPVPSPNRNAVLVK